ncbi:MAG: hypothetical protein ACI4O0_07320 [Candidatus Limivicinus sp.]
MKMKKLVSLVIVLLLVCGMPVSAFAEDVNLGDVKSLNEDIINTNAGTVETNANTGTVETNNGTVGKTDENGEVDASTGNFGTIGTNGKEGSVLINQENGKVLINYGTVATNESGSCVGDFYVDPDDGFVFDLSSGNFGTVTTNEGTVTQNGGYLFLSDGNGGYTVDFNTGAVIGTNAEGGLVIYNYSGSTVEENSGTVLTNNGTVEANNGTVETNRGSVENNENGKVEYNYGTVINEEGGTLYEYIGEDFQLLNTITAAGTYYGIIFEQGWVWEDDQYTTQWDGAALLQKQAGDVVDLNTLFLEDGYEVTGYFVKKYDFDDNFYRYDGEYISSAAYTVSEDSASTALELIWGKIKAAFSSSNEPEAAVVDVPTAVSAEYVRVGTTVQAKGQIFKVIEMDDGFIVVVTMVKLSEEDKDDLMAYLGKYLTPQQLELLLSEPELVSTELADKLFGGDTNHVVFKAAKNLFEK